MAVVTADEQIGRQKAAERKLRTVGAAARRFDVGRNAYHFVGFERRVHDVHAFFQGYGHVVVLVMHFQRGIFFAPPLVELSNQHFEMRLAGIEEVGVMVADDVGQLAFIDAAADVRQVVVALVQLGVGGRFGRRKRPGEFDTQHGGVDHFVLGGAGMDDDASDGHAGLRGVEGLVGEGVASVAVNGVGEVGAVLVQVPEFGAVADFLIGAEADHHFAVFELGMPDHVLHGGHNHGDARLVVGAEKGGAVGDDERVADVFFQVVESVGRHDDVFFGVENDVAAVVFFNQPGLDVFAGDFKSGVDVGAKSDGRRAGTVGRNGSAHIGVVRNGDVLDAHGAQFFAQQLCQIELTGRTGNAVRSFLRLRVDFYVAHKAIDQ